MTQLDTQNCPAYVLAGGKHTRFGDDKALVELPSGEVQLMQLINALKGFGHPTHVVADRRDRYASRGIECLVDACPGLGPMAALVTAAAHRSETYGEGWLLLINVDQIRWTLDWYTQLSAAAAAGILAIHFQQEGADQPIPALYHSGVLAAAQQALKARRLSLRNLLQAVPSATIEPKSNPRDWSFNTREELARILRQS